MTQAEIERIAKALAKAKTRIRSLASPENQDFFVQGVDWAMTYILDALQDAREEVNVSEFHRIAEYDLGSGYNEYG